MSRSKISKLLGLALIVSLVASVALVLRPNAESLRSLASNPMNNQVKLWAQIDAKHNKVRWQLSYKDAHRVRVTSYKLCWQERGSRRCKQVEVKPNRKNSKATLVAPARGLKPGQDYKVDIYLNRRWVSDKQVAVEGQFKDRPQVQSKKLFGIF